MGGRGELASYWRPFARASNLQRGDPVHDSRLHAAGQSRMRLSWAR